MNAEVKQTELAEMNDMFKAYGGFDVNKGTFGMYTEVAAKDGKFAGYVKPLLKSWTSYRGRARIKRTVFFKKSGRAWSGAWRS